MILADLHTHTKYSHGGNTPDEMFAAAQAKGLAYMGFTEHSPRPVGFDYTHEYREQLTFTCPTTRVRYAPCVGPMPTARAACFLAWMTAVTAKATIFATDRHPSICCALIQRHQCPTHHQHPHITAFSGNNNNAQ